MKRDGNRLAWLGGLAVCAGLCTLPTVTSGMGYDRITERNVFALKPPPPPVDPNAVKEEAPSKITLTGITTILGNKRALLRVAVAAGKEENYMLTEGQRDGSVEVLEIDEKAGSVKVSNAGQVATLTFDKNGAKAAPGAVPTPLAIPPPNFGAPATTVPAPNALPAPGNVPRTIPSRLPRVPGTGEVGSAETPVGQPGYAVGMPGMNMQQSHNNLSLEERAILYEANRVKNEEASKAGLVPRMPVHPVFKSMMPQPNQEEAPQ